jgi:hypothetical protein
MNATLDSALYWTGWGSAVIPVVYQDKKPEIDWKQYQTELPDTEHLQHWFGNSVQHNIALVTGHQGLTVIDFDDQQIYQDWLAFGQHWPHIAALQRFTYQVETVKGRHVYVRLPEATQSRVLVKSDGTRWNIDIKSRGGCILTVPSIHPTGIPYRAVNSGAAVWFVESLSMIIPADMLKNDRLTSPRLPRRVSMLDPWQAAMNPVRLGPDTVARVKAAYKLEDLLPVEKITGANFYLTRCPLHDDHNPSMWVNTEQQICGCYAGCTSKPLDVINLYARVNDLTNSEAIRELAKEC